MYNSCREWMHYLLLEALQQVGMHCTVVEQKITIYGSRCPLKHNTAAYRPQSLLFSCFAVGTVYTGNWPLSLTSVREKLFEMFG